VNIMMSPRAVRTPAGTGSVAPGTQIQTYAFVGEVLSVAVTARTVFKLEVIVNRVRRTDSRARRQQAQAFLGALAHRMYVVRSSN
jgi:hypothetical protein